MTMLTALRKYALGIAIEEAAFSRRSFAPTPCQSRLEQIGQIFISGYNQALETNKLSALVTALDQHPEELRGFACEGAAMGLALIDWLTCSRLKRWRQFAAALGDRHVYMLHVGAGWAAARLPWIRLNVERHLAAFDPLLRWLVIDGYGFHQGYFQPRRYLIEGACPRLSHNGLRAFDQGLGRSLWFACGADVAAIHQRIGGLAPLRHNDLWSGVGLACAYAGGCDESSLTRLLNACGENRPALAQGVAFAAKTRIRAGNLTGHTELASRLLCGSSAHESADVTDECLKSLTADGQSSAYELWRLRIQESYQIRPEELCAVDSAASRT